jgi:DNA-binding SARP family transcriptional activator
MHPVSDEGGRTVQRSVKQCARLSLLGTFAFTINVRPLIVPLTAQRLLAFLGLHSPVDRQTAAGHLWPDMTDARAAACLRAALSKAQRSCSFAIFTAGTNLSLAPWVLTDTQELRDVARYLIAGGLSALDTALRLIEFRAELLPAWDEEWLVLDREELRQIQLQALECCGTRLLQEGHFTPAVMLAYKAIHADPFRESAHRQLIEIHLAQGNRVQALEVYQAFERQLWQDCRIRPSSMLDKLMQLPGFPSGAASRPAI